jgi:hypothetical protein
MDEDFDFENFNEYADEDGDFEEYEGPQFIADIKAAERTGVAKGEIGGISAEAKKLQRLQKQIESDEYFKTLLEISIKKYNEILKLNNEQLGFIRNSYYTLNNPNFKNSACLLISYYCLDKNKNILEDKLKKVKNNILKNEKDFKIEDIIRYCRLWKNIYP